MTTRDTALAPALLAHFDAHARAMPWRETSDPYAIWVSEVMLQQTRVDTVVPYFERWLDRFPTVDRLAAAPLDAVLKEWEGLGYYSRARNLHRAARLVRERHDGVLPDTVAGLRELPGIGEYTAGAVASIAFDIPTPAVDGNVRRVLARLYDLEAPTAAELRERAAALVPADRPGDYNQALMELGATICTPRSPDCHRCPIAEWCQARALGVQEERPRRKARKEIPEEAVRTLLLLRPDGTVLLERRPEDGLLGGLWEFPGIPAGAPLPAALAPLVEEADPGTPPEPVVHTFSHKRVAYRPELLRVGDGAGAGLGPVATVPDDAGDRAWVPVGALGAFALPVAQRTLAGSLEEALAGGQPPVRSR